MGEHYDHFTLEERCTIARLRESGQPIRQIAAALDRSPSTISRELKRNHGVSVGYKPAYADQQASARRWKGSRLERDEKLRELVLSGLERGWSPEQVAGWLDRHGERSISHESIYRFIYAQIRRTNDGAWRHYLPRAKAKRGWRGRKGGSPASFIQDRVSIALRPAAAGDRRTPGHWEADLMLFARYGQAILVVHERTSRILLLAKQPSKKAQPTVAQLIAWFAVLDKRLRRTVTFDNGTEFAQHYSLKGTLGIRTFFCDTHSPWQKGGIENAIGRMRRPLPRKTDLATLDPDSLMAYVVAYNNTPRKCLGFKSPAEVFLSQLLRFKCESTFRLSPGRRQEGMTLFIAT
jgi:transposase, IS30 family